MAITIKINAIILQIDSEESWLLQNYIFEVFCASFPSRYYWFKVNYSAVLFVNFEHISHIVLLIPLFTLNMGYVYAKTSDLLMSFLEKITLSSVLFIYTFTKLYSDWLCHSSTFNNKIFRIYCKYCFWVRCVCQLKVYMSQSIQEWTK